MQPGSDFNPYAPPTELADRSDLAYSAGAHQVLATLGQRWMGAFIDGILYGIAIVPAAFAAGWSGEKGGGNGVFIAVAVGVVLFLPLAIYQTVITANTGQSIGKKIAKTRIVKLDGSPPGFMHGVFLRSWVIGVLGAIPWIGSFISLADTLMIFRSDRRMLHDHIAGTQVIALL